MKRFLLFIILLLPFALYGDKNGIWEIPSVSLKALAKDLYSSGDYWGAINKLETYLVKHQNDKEARELLGKCYLEVGRESFQKGNYVEAIALLKKSIKNLPDNPESWYLLGVSLLKIEHYDESIEALEKVRQLKPDYRDVKKLLVKLYLKRGKEEFKYGHYEKSINYLIKILPLQPDNYEALFYLGLDYYNSGKLEKAFSYFSQSVKDKKFELYSNFYMGFIQYQLSAYKKAIPYFLKSMNGDLKEKSKYYLSRCYYNIAVSDYQKKNFKESETYFLKVLSLYPQHVDAHFGLALVYFNTEKYFKAAEHLENVKKLKGNYRNTYQLLAETYFRIAQNFIDKGKLKEAEKYFTLCYKNDPERGDAYYNLAEIYYKWKKYDKALEFYERSIDKKYRIVDSTYKIGEIYYVLKKYEKSVTYLEKVYAWKKKYLKTVTYLWTAYRTLGNRAFTGKNYTDSEAYYAKSLFYNPQQPLIRYRYAVSLYQNGKYMDSFSQLLTLVKQKKTKFDKFWSYLFRSSLNAGKDYFARGYYHRAIQVLEKHLAFFPGSIEAKYYAGLSYLSLNDFDNAIKYLSDVVKKQPDYKDAKIKLSLAYKNKGKNLFGKGKYAEAERNFYLALIYNPEDIEARYFYGWSLLKQKKYWKSIVQLEKVIKKDKNYKDIKLLLAKAYLNIANPLFEKKKYSEVIPLYKRVIKLFPDDPDTNLKLGISLFHTGKLDEALNFLQKAYKLGASYLYTNYYLGEIYFWKKEYLKAYPYLTAVYEKKPDFMKVKDHYAKTTYQIGRIKEKEGAYEDAIAMYMNSYNLFPTNFKYTLAVARVAAKMNDLKTAIEFYERLVTNFKWYYKAHIPLATLYLKTGEFEKILALLLPDYKIKDPEFQASRIKILLETYRKYSESLFRKGEYDKALRIVKKGLKFFPGDIRLSLTHAKILAGMKKYRKSLSLVRKLFARNKKIKEDAIKVFLLIGKNAENDGKYRIAIRALKYAYKISPDNEDVLFYLAYAYYETGKYLKAFKFLEKLHSINPGHPYLIELAKDTSREAMKKLIKGGQEKEILSFFNRAIKLVQGYGELYYLIGEFYYQKGKDEKALTYLKRCEELEGKDYKNLRKYMADIYFSLAKESYNKKDLNSTLNYLSLSLKYVKENPEVFLMLARLYKDEGNDIMAKDYLGRALLLNPDLLKKKEVENLGYSLGITSETRWKKFLRGIGVKKWPEPVTGN